MIGQLIATGDTYDIGMNAINTAFSGQASFNTLSAETTYVGQLTIGVMGTGTPVSNIAVNSSGVIVTGSMASSSAFQSLVDAATIVWGYDLGSNAEVTLGGNRTLNITGTTDGAFGTLIVKQDGSGNRNLSLTGTTGTHKIVNGGGGSIKLTSNANAEDIISFVYRSSPSPTFYWNIGYDYN